MAAGLVCLIMIDQKVDVSIGNMGMIQNVE
jgi:hypothetical protein